MMPLISTDVFAIIALCFTIGLAKRNVVMDNKKNMIYISASAITIVLLVLEIMTLLMELSTDSKLIIPHRIANILGFSLSPVVPFILLFFNRNKSKNIYYNVFLTILLFFNTVICILSYKTGFIFFVDDQNQYTRGNLFLMPTLISIFYYVLFLITAIKKIIEYEMEEKKILIPLFCIPLAAIALQIIYRDLILIWSSTALSLLLYYIFLLELQFRHDVQTKIKNRAAFEKQMEQYVSADKNAIIVMLDLNNLKTTNDKYGHKAGDEMLFEAAKIIEESFMGIGTAYRIGGDEFCVICKETSKDQLDIALANLDDLSVKVNKNRHIKITLAYGHAFYDKNESVSIYSTLAEADKAMYNHKAKLKGFHSITEG